jgi:4-cresol dehydrogenase (hydroxylating)
MHTGFDHLESSKVSRVFKWGVGPYLDGIFTQSNLGIVTSMGVWLMPKPEYFEACYFSCEYEEDIYELIAPLRNLLQAKAIQSSVNLAHRNRALTMLMQYPWESMNGKTPLEEKVSLQLAKERKLGAWNGVCGLYGSKNEVKAAKKKIKRQLRGKVSRINFVSESLLSFMQRYPKILSLVSGMDISELVKVIKPSFGILTGKPSEVSLASPYWRSRRPPPKKKINPVADNCGLYWFAPVVPMTSEYAKVFIQIVNSVVPKHGFEALIMFSTVTDRCFDCNLPILYDKESEAESRKAERCYEELYNKCMEAGFIPYRVGIQSMKMLTSEYDSYWQVVGKIKKALDPNNIIAPKRYNLY